ncbi:MAG: hypothetical protein J0L99_19670 [Chitinophagales bacterium]|nr:hypothetical protein [Chitinophagales bacterium]
MLLNGEKMRAGAGNWRLNFNSGTSAVLSKGNERRAIIVPCWEKAARMTCVRQNGARGIPGGFEYGTKSPQLWKRAGVLFFQKYFA